MDLENGPFVALPRLPENHCRHLLSQREKTLSRFISMPQKNGNAEFLVQTIASSANMVARKGGSP
jgi:hypothetical protein